MRTVTWRQVKRLRSEATRLKKEKGIQHSKALDEIAVAQGFKSWPELMAAVSPDSRSEQPEAGAIGEQARYFVHGDADETNSEMLFCEFCDTFEREGHFESKHAEDGGRKVLRSLEVWRKLPLETKVQYRRSDGTANLFQDLYPKAQSSPAPTSARSANGAQEGGMFHTWLRDQEWRPDAVGEFARRVPHDPQFPVNSDAVDAMRRYLQGASRQERAAFEEAWEDFLVFARAERPA